MKVLILTLTLLVGLNGYASQPDLVNIMPTDVFTPNGFDNNDNAQIVLEGYYPNTCYKTGLSEYQVDEVNKVIVVDDQTYHYPYEMCLMMIVPYTKVIELGVLQAGNYDVKFLKDGKFSPSKAKLDIYEAPHNIQDDFLYLPVNKSHFLSKGPNGKPAVVLEGIYKNSCFSFDRAEVKRKAGAKTIEILPIAKMEGQNCRAEDKPFKVTVDVDHAGAGHVLLHIRSLNGQAVNHIVNL